MGERECGGKAREEQPQNNKDNSKMIMIVT